MTQFIVRTSDPNRFDVVNKNNVLGGMTEIEASDSAQRYIIEMAARRLETMLSSGTARFGRPSGHVLERLMVLASLADAGERAVIRSRFARNWEELLAEGAVAATDQTGLPVPQSAGGPAPHR